MDGSDSPVRQEGDIANSEIVGTTDVVVDADLSAEKVRKLIELQREEERLEYTSAFPVSGKKYTKEKLEFVRDVVAMANTHGGYVVLGLEEREDADRRYDPVGIEAEIGDELDIDRLAPQIERYVTARLGILLQVRSFPEYENRTFACVFVPKSDALPIIFERVGTYEVEPGKQSTVFRQGEIFVRRGASSVRADQDDMRRIISEIRRREKAQWTEDILGMRELTKRLDRLIELLSGGEIPAPRPSKEKQYDEASFYLAGPAFENHILDLLEGGKLLSVRRYLDSAPSLFFGHISEPSEADADSVERLKDNRLRPLLDNLVVLGVVLIHYDQRDTFERLVRVLHVLCKQAAKTKFPELNDPSVHFGPSWVWREVIARVYALGAILVGEGRYEWVPVLVRHEPDWDVEYWQKLFWAKYIAIQLSREKRLEEASLCRLAEVYIGDFEVLNKEFFGDTDQIRATACQFDFLQCVHAVEKNGDPGHSWPSFGIYQNHRTEPVIASLIEEGPARAAIPEMSNQLLADIIRELDYYAGKQFIRHNGWDTGFWTNKSISDFLGRHPASSE